MAYYKDFKHPPYTEGEDQDMWVGTISFEKDKPDDIRHTECIEVRADDEALLDARMTLIVDALNGGTPTLKVET